MQVTTILFYDIYKFALSSISFLDTGFYFIVYKEIFNVAWIINFSFSCFKI